MVLKITAGSFERVGEDLGACLFATNPGGGVGGGWVKGHSDISPFSAS